MNKGYIYIRNNEWYELKGVCKVGITKSIKDRNNTYITGEIIRGKFIKIFELESINENKLKIIDNIIKLKFKKLNVYIDGGTEFYDKIIIDKIEDFLIKHKIKFTFVNEEELNRKIKLKNKLKELFNSYIINNSNNTNNKIKPKEHQINIINKIEDFYMNNDIGNLIWTCGLGKSLLSIFIIQKLKFKKILIGVPSCFLQNQFANEIIQIFKNEDNIMFINNYFNNNNNDINNFLSKNTNTPLFIITTYHSCNLFINNNLIFDFKIGDECHHLVGKDDNDNHNNDNQEKRRFIQFHKINSKKTLYMTATKKTILNKEDHNNYYSMENEEIFGKTIDEKTFKWAIDNKIITNYKIIIIQNEINDFIEIKNKISSFISNKELFICVYLTLKSLISFNENAPSHLLLYTNEIKDADLAKNYIKDILNYGIIDINIDDLYYDSLHSNLNNHIIQDGLKNFKEKKYGIICCVQLFGEGINCPIIDGITIACNMISEIKIVQYLLRANRLLDTKPNKIAYYIIPYLYNHNYMNISYIIKQLANYDNTIEQKIILSSIISSPFHNNLKENIKISNFNDNDNINDNDKYEFIENPELLLKIKMRLRNSKDLICDFTEEENEYNYVKSINMSLKLTSKIDYINSNKNHNHEYFIENPDKYFTNKGVWINWCDFLGYDTSNLIATKEKWINFCKEKEIKTIEDYNKNLLIFNELPKDPEDFYNDFTNISNELLILYNKKKRR